MNEAAQYHIAANDTADEADFLHRLTVSAYRSSSKRILILSMFISKIHAQQNGRSEKRSVRDPTNRYYGIDNMLSFQDILPVKR